MNNIYQKALACYNQGEYESALNILSRYEDAMSINEKYLIEECKKQIEIQYILLIQQALEEKEFHTAKNLQYEYKGRFGINPNIEGIIIPNEEKQALKYEGYSFLDEQAKEDKLRIIITIIVFVIIGGIILLLIF